MSGYVYNSISLYTPHYILLYVQLLFTDGHVGPHLPTQARYILFCTYSHMHTPSTTLKSNGLLYLNRRFHPYHGRCARLLEPRRASQKATAARAKFHCDTTNPIRMLVDTWTPSFAHSTSHVNNTGHENTNMLLNYEAGELLMAPSFMSPAAERQIEAVLQTMLHS